MRNYQLTSCGGWITLWRVKLKEPATPKYKIFKTYLTGIKAVAGSYPYRHIDIIIMSD